MSRLATLFAALADGLELLAQDRDERIAALARAHLDTEDPGTDHATQEAARRLSERVDAVPALFLSVAQHIDDDHGGSVDPLGFGAPLTSETLRLEASFAAFMPRRWIIEVANAYRELAGAEERR
jgi:hypothetical protein